MEYTIRREMPADFRAVEALTREAFWNVYAPGCDEHYLAHILRDMDAFIPELDFVAEAEGILVGNIMYSKGWVEDAQGTRHDVILFGPLSVLPAWQGKGVGGALVRHSVEAARAMGFSAILIFGDPLYYSRFGFRLAEEYGITPPDGRPHPALQALPLREGALAGISGRFYESPAFHDALTPEAVAAFDSGFPPREKGFAESQRRFAELSGE